MPDYLKSVAEQLSKLVVGEECRIHELTASEASNEYYRKWNREHWPSTGGIVEQKREPVTFEDWCKENGYMIQHSPVSDYLIFRKIDAGQ